MTGTINYSDTFNFEKDHKRFLVSGVAFRSGLIESKRVRISDSELAGIATSLIGVPFLKDHSHSVDDVSGKVTKANVEGNLVTYRATIQDEDLQAKIEGGLINKVSIGLRVSDIIPFVHEGEEYFDLVGIEARELSAIVFPAVTESSIEFNLIIDKDEDQTDDQHQTSVLSVNTSVDPLNFENYLKANDLIAMSTNEWADVQLKLDEMRITVVNLDKLNFIQTCDEDFQEVILSEDINSLSKIELKRLYDVWQKAIETGGGSDSRGVVSDGNEDFVDNTIETKEDVRELIFHSRRDGLKHKKLRDIRDIKLKG